MVDSYLSGPPSLARRLLSGSAKTAAAFEADRKGATKDMLAEWQRSWDKVTHKSGEEKQGAFFQHFCRCRYRRECDWS